MRVQNRSALEHRADTGRHLHHGGQGRLSTGPQRAVVAGASMGEGRRQEIPHLQRLVGGRRNQVVVSGKLQEQTLSYPCRRLL